MSDSRLLYEFQLGEEGFKAIFRDSPATVGGAVLLVDGWAVRVTGTSIGLVL